MKTARYAGIKRFAVHDGPGIRTTLFLKGCTLACKWCHNPEAISSKPQLAIHHSKCAHCGDCAKVCSNHVVTVAEHTLRRESCIGCGKCVETCLFGALELFGRSITSEAAGQLLLEDKRFYGNGGGITVSGGEPLLQAEFCAELFQIMQREQVSCAVDTCGNIAWSEFEKVLPYADVFLYDLKEINSEKHKAFTGRDNALILENLCKLNQTGKKIEIRMIQVPGWNTEESDLEGAAEFLSNLKHITAIRLLPYHSLAHSKYQDIGRYDSMPKTASPSLEYLENRARILRDKGLAVITPKTD